MLVEENQMEKKGVPALLMTILGLSLAGNIVYLFTVGSTHFTVAEIYSVLLFLYLIATKRIDWYRIASVIGIEFQIIMCDYNHVRDICIHHVYERGTHI